MGTSENRLVLMSTHNLCFEQKYEKNIRIILSENFHFFVVKFSVYLNRHVFVMAGHTVGRQGSKASSGRQDDLTLRWAYMQSCRKCCSPAQI